MHLKRLQSLLSGWLNDSISHQCVCIMRKKHIVLPVCLRSLGKVSPHFGSVTWFCTEQRATNMQPDILPKIHTCTKTMHGLPKVWNEHHVTWRVYIYVFLQVQTLKGKMLPTISPRQSILQLIESLRGSSSSWGSSRVFESWAHQQPWSTSFAIQCESLYLFYMIIRYFW